MTRALLLALALLAGCYDARHDACAIACAQPSDCYQVGFSAETAACDHGFCTTMDHACNPDAGGGDAGDAGGDGAPPPSFAMNVAAGSGFACAIDLQGTLSCWGDNSAGEVAPMGSGDVASPSPVARGSNWTQIAAGGHTACGMQHGSLYCWGDNSSGQCGDQVPPSVMATAVPSLIPPQFGGWSKFAVGDAHACAIAGSDIYCWGNNESGQLGIGALQGGGATPHPALRDANQDPYVDVWAGPTETCGLAQSSSGGYTLLCWGDATNNRLAGALGPSPYPLPIALADDSQPLQVSIGRYAVCARLASRNLFCWGDNQYGTIVMGSPTANTSVIQIPGSYDDVSTGGTETCAISSGSLACWGTALGGGLGAGFWTLQEAGHIPIATGASRVVVGDCDDFAGKVSPADQGEGDLACALLDGALTCWGANRFGQLGTKRASRQFAPVTAIEAAQGSAAMAMPHELVAGDHHSCVARSGNVICWGATDEGQADGATRSGGNAPGDLACGSGVLCDVDHPAPLAFSVHPGPSAQLTAGRNHTCALQQQSSGAATTTLSCWGANEQAQLGNPGPAPFVQQMLSVTGTGSVYATADQGCVRGADNALQCWGAVDLEAPLTGPTAVTSYGIVAGIAFTDTTGVVLHPTGMSSWTGDNSHFEYGYKGSGSGANGGVLPPAFDTGQTQMFSKIAMSDTGDFACGLDASPGSMFGGVYCWGAPIANVSRGSTGASGDTFQVVPGPCTALAVGAAHACAICGGMLTCFGDDTVGQLGVVGASGLTHPSPPPGATWLEVSATLYGTCAIDSTGQVQCWGDGMHGELGNRGGAASWPGERWVELPQP